MKSTKLMQHDVRTCGPDDDLNAAATIMWEHDCGLVPVVDEQMHVVGMITDRDICMAAYTRGRPLGEIAVRSVMSKRVHSCRDTDRVRDVQELMRKEQVRRVPVVDGERKLVGLLTLNDLACAAVNGRPSHEKEPTLGDVGLTLAAICAHRTADGAALQPRSTKRAATCAPAVVGS